MRTATLRSWACRFFLLLLLIPSARASGQEPPAAGSAVPAQAPGINQGDLAARLLSEGRRRLDEGKREEALALLSDPVFEGHPLWEFAAGWRARALRDSGRAAEALPLWRRLFDVLPEPSFRHEAAAALLEASRGGPPEEAVPFAKALWRSSPDLPEYGAALAQALSGAGRVEEAREVALDLWTRFPGPGPASDFLASRPDLAPSAASAPPDALLRRLREAASAKLVSLMAQELPRVQPATPAQEAEKTLLTGRWEELRGRPAEAFSHYRRASETPETAQAAVVRMALVASRCSLSEKALGDLEASVLALPCDAPWRDRAVYALVKLRLARRSETRALDLASKGLCTDHSSPDLAEVLYDAAWGRWTSGRRREAEALWRAMAGGLPARSDDRLAAVYCLLRLGRVTDPDQAAAFRQEIEFHDAFGYFGYRLRQGFPPAAEPDPPLPLPEPSPATHEGKGRLLFDAGLYDEAASEWRAVPGETAPSVCWALARARTEAGDPSGAILEARKAYPLAYSVAGLRTPEAAWKAIYPISHPEAVRAASRESGLPPLFVCSVIRQESLWDPSAVSRSGALGLMQLMPPTARSAAASAGLQPFTPERACDPEWNVRVGSFYLASMLGRYRGRPHVALAAYNAGPRRADEWTARPGAPLEADLWIESIPFRETRSYVRRILLNLWEYGRIYPEWKECESIPAEARAFYSPTPSLLCP
ncbi:MAG: lytic transglycosylase domain-containing protein [Acidobacteriota bacterium]